MSEAIKLIVNTCVRLGSSTPLEDLLENRRKIGRQLQSISGFDLSVLTSAIDEEIALIGAGIKRSKSPHPGTEDDAVEEKPIQASAVTETVSRAHGR